MESKILSLFLNDQLNKIGYLTINIRRIIVTFRGKKILLKNPSNTG